MSRNLNDLMTPPPIPGGDRNPNPKMYKVWALDDPSTPMEFAKTLYESFYRVSGDETLKTIHEAGKALLGVYTLEIAETLIGRSILRSHKAGYDMQFQIEPEQTENENPDENLLDPA